ncbi:hypothetical protein GUJ93_ZPchr0012g19690 [Zizania palustris]|uniref:Uncharacterized protein n=1 Tax=Zizania palustris TaxID=103762 RepID=A0A8J6BWJ9_ZIZPA|nr:hypothetical protein GUJ93_ZPchr0012g19690 [Zizania palustris]
MCHGPIKHGHKCESSFTRMKIIIDSTESDDDTNRAAASGFGTKRTMASGSSTKRQKVTVASGSDTKLDVVKEMLQYLIEKIYVLKEKIYTLIEKGLKK